ncbi:ROK family protein [Spiroplasma endosymbiont of Aspidapion aeneum]|uniref:ROK family protein n=1 Tax=Spiroplasma endosymbiont of Aspidapion aeneum TaxID=3066276 RepID=UPI00313AFF20
MLKLAFDIGGSAIKIGWINKDYKIIKRDRIEHNGLRLQFDEVVKEIEDYIDKQDLSQFSDICISSPGAIEKKTGKILGINAVLNSVGKSYVKSFSKKYNQKIYCENDSNCATLAELKIGNAIGVDNAIIVVVGSGVGGSLVINKQLYRGSSYFAGELGFVYEGEVSEDIKKMFPMIKAKVGSFYGMYFLCAKYEHLTKTKKNGEQIFALYEKDNIAKECVDEIIFGLAKIISNATAVVDPSLVLIGGAVSANDTFLRLLKKKIKIIYFDKMVANGKFKVNRCKFGNDSNLLGAALLVEES